MFQLMFQSVFNLFQLHVSMYVSTITIGTKRIILFHNYKFVSRVGFISILERIIIGQAPFPLLSKEFAQLYVLLHV